MIARGAVGLLDGSANARIRSHNQRGGPQNCSRAVVLPAGYLHGKGDAAGQMGMEGPVLVFLGLRNTQRKGLKRSQIPMASLLQVALKMHGQLGASAADR